MVEVGTLEITGSMDTVDIEQGFSRINADFKEVETQSNQSMASLRKTSSVVGGLAKTLVGMGIAGVAAMTALAVKSPVLAGTMAKIELQTLKLSNTVGRQLKPIFEAISGSLLPALNKAFQDNAEDIGIMVDKTVAFVEALSDLIGLDWSGLLDNLDDLFKPRGTPEEGGIFKETIQRIKNLFVPEEDESLVGFIGRKALRATSPLGMMEDIGKLNINLLIDFIQWLSSKKDDKEMTFATSTGVTR